MTEGNATWGKKYKTDNGASGKVKINITSVCAAN